ncbi:hypothetical protein VNO78_09655 [Psophocarpus tetragonolobus]|uniref:Uncharacterized protein n=1 Tax=Psophocarpus tetragonolobus TaxID=3891 RepID=A0AAN9SZK1_PSOTE
MANPVKKDEKKVGSEIAFQEDKAESIEKNNFCEEDINPVKKDKKKVGSAIAFQEPLNDTEEKAESIEKNEEDINIKEEMFMHDHPKCIAKKTAISDLFPALVLSEDDHSISFGEDLEVPDSPLCLPEVPMQELSDSEQWNTPPISPSPQHSPLSSLAREYEIVKFVLK